MCIICAKPAGVKFPKNEYIENMWDGNDDGAGIMWVSNNKVHIKKGFMKLKDFKRFLGKLKKRYDIVSCCGIYFCAHHGSRCKNRLLQ